MRGPPQFGINELENHFTDVGRKPRIRAMGRSLAGIHMARVASDATL